MFRSRENVIRVENNQGTPLVHNLQSANTVYYKSIIAGGIIILLGVFSGYFLANRTGKTQSGDASQTGSAQESAVGSKDTKTFRDSAEGELEAGGINDEGTHRLIRPGGESQTVALTSSVMDLSKFEGKKVKVWGETFAGKESGWFMDVGKVEVVE